MHWTLMSNKKIVSIKLLKLKYRREGPNNSDILQIWLTPEITFPFFNLYKFENPERSTPESYQMHWNQIKGEEFGSKNF